MVWRGGCGKGIPMAKRRHALGMTAWNEREVAVHVCLEVRQVGLGTCCMVHMHNYAVVLQWLSPAAGQLTPHILPAHQKNEYVFVNFRVNVSP